MVKFLIRNRIEIIIVSVI